MKEWWQLGYSRCSFEEALKPSGKRRAFFYVRLFLHSMMVLRLIYSVAHIISIFLNMKFIVKLVSIQHPVLIPTGALNAHHPLSPPSHPPSTLSLFSVFKSLLRFGSLPLFFFSFIMKFIVKLVSIQHPVLIPTGALNTHHPPTPPSHPP